MNKNAFIFDLDGTLVNTLSDIADSVNGMLTHFGYTTHSEDSIRKMIGKGARNLIFQALPENNRNVAFVDEALEYYRSCYDKNLIVKTYVYNGLYEVLNKLKRKGCKLAVLSNKDDRHVKRIVSTLMPDLFVTANGFSPLFPHKPAPDAVFAIMKEMNVTSEETAFVGDSCVDVNTAANAGLLSVGVTWGFGGIGSFKDNAPNAFVHTPEQLLDI